MRAIILLILLFSSMGNRPLINMLNEASNHRIIFDESRIQLKESNLNAEFVDNCGCELNHFELKKYAKDLKEKSKHKQFIVVSNQKEIIDVANKLIKL